MKDNKEPATLKLVHYGSEEFKPEKFIQPNGEAKINVKPVGGLWASPVDSKYGWSDWVKDNDYGDLSKSFTFQFTGILLVIDSINDMQKLPWTLYKGSQKILFGKIISRYDGMMVTEKGERETRFSFPQSLYGWDCESVVVFNKECIITQQY